MGLKEFCIDAQKMWKASIKSEKLKVESGIIYECEACRSVKCGE
jgi:hypothetical protein